MSKISYEVIGKDHITNKSVELTILATSPAEAKQVIAEKHPRIVVDVVYPTKYKLIDIDESLYFDDVST